MASPRSLDRVDSSSRRRPIRGPDAFAGGQANLAALHAARDAHGRPFEVSILDPGADPGVSYANHFIANGAVIVPVTGDDRDGPVLDVSRRHLPRDREVIGVPGATLAFGGGGPHCITQQIPEGSPAPI